jgi:hypothetical protein
MSEHEPEQEQEPTVPFEMKVGGDAEVIPAEQVAAEQAEQEEGESE